MALRSFQTRLVVSFLILISVVLIGSLLAVNWVIERSARAHVKAELATAAKVVTGLLDARKERLVHAARILSGDFAFKQVVALGDHDTLLSAMDNHRARINAELMLVVSLDGSRTVDTLRRSVAVPQLITAARRVGEVSDVVLVDGRPYQAVVVPLLAPAPIAWIGMGFPIDRGLADELRTTTGARIHVVLQRPLAEAMAPYRPLRAALLVLFGVAATVSIVGGVWIARDVSRPVRQLADAARKIEAGQYGATVPITRQDELGELTTTFNRMTSAVAEREERLRASEERFRAMTESAADAVVTTDGAGVVVAWNRGAQTIFGYTADEALGMPLARVLPGGAADGAGRGVTKDGREIPVEISFAAWETRQGAFRTGIIRDVTERRQLEEQVRQSQKMESIGRLAGGVAHDFNSLLTVITGHGELLETDLEGDETLLRRVRVINEAASHAGDLTRQLLAFSRKQVLAPKILDLNTTMAGIEPMLRRLIGEDIALVVKASAGFGRVEADPTQITQIVLNLAVNARDAMPHGGKLTIETANVELDETHVHCHPDMRSGAYVMLAVTDIGIGMDEATRSKVFEPFFTTKETGKGTGLGLAMVYGIVKQSNGTIGVYSEPGVGTSFEIYLPPTPSSTRACSTSARRSSPSRSTPARSCGSCARCSTSGLEDHARGGRAAPLALPLRELERLVDLGQREAVRDHLRQRVAVLRPHEEVERGGHYPRVVVHEPAPLDLIGDDLRRGERHRLRHDVADVHELAVEADHVEAFDRRRGDAHDLHDDVRAAPVGEVLHARDPLGRRLQLVDVDRIGRATPLRHLQPVRLAVDRDHLRRAARSRDRRRVDAEAAGALDHHDVAELQFGVLEAVEDLAERAVDRRDRLVRKRVGHLEHVVARRQEVVLRVAAVTIRILVQGELLAAAIAMRARVMLAADAPVAAVARVEERERDAVALFERPAQRVGGDALAEAVHDTRELVPGHLAHVGPGVVVVVAPVMEVGAADGGRGVLDEDAARLDLRRRQRFERERLAGLVENDGQSFGHRWTPSWRFGFLVGRRR